MDQKQPIIHAIKRSVNVFHIYSCLIQYNIFLIPLPIEYHSNGCQDQWALSEYSRQCGIIARAPDVTACPQYITVPAQKVTQLKTDRREGDRWMTQSRKQTETLIRFHSLGKLIIREAVSRSLHLLLRGSHVYHARRWPGDFRLIPHSQKLNACFWQIWGYL